MKKKSVKSLPRNQAVKANTKQKLDHWWQKYEAAADLDREFPPSPVLVFSLLNSVHQHRLEHAALAVNLEEDSRHHLTMQKFFKKWREVHGTRI